MDSLNNYLSDLMTNHYYEYDSESDGDTGNEQLGGSKPTSKGGIPLVRECKSQKRTKVKETTDKSQEKREVKIENSINITDIIRIKRNKNN